MKKLLTLTSLALIALVAKAAPVSGDLNLGFTSKLISNGAVVGTNYALAGVGTNVYGIDLAVNTFTKVSATTTTSTAVVAGKTVTTSTTDATGLKRIYVDAGYKFTSPLADLTLGAELRHISATEAGNAPTHNLLPFVKLSGSWFGGHLNWQGRALNDTVNRSNNFELGVSAPLNTFGDLKVVPAFAVGFNDPGAATIAALKNVKKYYQPGIGLEWHGIEANLFAQRTSLTSTATQITGYNVGYKLKF
jgi:hypothetical protein